MKRTLGVTLAVLAAVSAMAQGTVNFANLGAGVNAPVYYRYDGTTKVGPECVAQLWAGPTADSLVAVSPLVHIGTTGAGPGYFLGGPTAVPTVPPGSPAFFQVRAWSAAGGTTWEAAVAASQTDSSIVWGFNNMDPEWGVALSVLQTPPLGGGPVTPPNLVGLTSFYVGLIPEPSVIALGALAGLGLLIRRRR